MSECVREIEGTEKEKEEGSVEITIKGVDSVFPPVVTSQQSA